jgi:ATP-dependent Zn protease
MSNLKTSMKLNMEFEIVDPEKIDTKLSDVKGIDEIKDEIENLIKMIKNPMKYQ